MQVAECEVYKVWAFMLRPYASNLGFIKVEGVGASVQGANSHYEFECQSKYRQVSGFPNFL